MAKAKNWAIVVGINAYENIGQLRYANRDAAALRDFFYEAKFDRVFCFADGLQLSPEPNQKSVQPRYSDLVNFLHYRFTTKIPPLSAGDNCWFFFAGHGKRIQDCDYLLPQDYNPSLINSTQLAISVNFVREALLKSGADNVILLLDACRTEGDRADGLGIGDEQPGAITIFSCQRNQKAYEIEALEQGAFTAALLEGLRMPKASDNCATVQRLDAHLRRRVPELCRLHPEQPVQTPATSVEPGQKWYLPLLPDVATEADIDRLKMEAYKTVQRSANLDLAEHLWIRVLNASPGTDPDAIRALQAIAVQKAQSSSVLPPGEQSSPPQTPPATLSLDLHSTDFRSLPSPVRPQYQREKVRQPISFPTPVSQPTQPAKSRSKKAFPWIRLIILGLPYGSYGMFLMTTSAPVWALALALGVGVLGTVAVPWNDDDHQMKVSILVWIAAVTLALGVGVLGALSIALTGFGVDGWGKLGAVSLGVGGIGALTGMMSNSRDKLLVSFSRFHTFLILAGTPLAGLGLGWLGYWAFKAASGH